MSLLLFSTEVSQFSKFIKMNPNITNSTLTEVSLRQKPSFKFCKRTFLRANSEIIYIFLKYKQNNKIQ